MKVVSITCKVGILLIIFLITNLGLFGQSLSPQTINSAGATYIYSDAIMNVSIGEVAIQTYSNSSAIINEGFQHPNLADFFQSITIPVGWSGISSFIAPTDSLLDTIYAGFTADTLMMSNFDSLYVKGSLSNDLTYWQSNAGKRIKVNDEYTVKYYGERLQYTVIQLEVGWNILPVLSTCAVTCDTVQAIIGSGFEMIIEIGSDRVYWPEKGITTLQQLVPGKAYYLKNSQISSFQYPECN